MLVFFFQAEDGIRDAQESRGLGDVYKRQDMASAPPSATPACQDRPRPAASAVTTSRVASTCLSLIHI